MKKVIIKKLILGSITIVAVPLLAISCGIVAIDNPDNSSGVIPSGRGDSRGTNNPNNNDFLISNYFENLQIRNSDNFTIDEWINNFNKDLDVDSSKPFSFNRTSADEKVDNDK